MLHLFNGFHGVSNVGSHGFRIPFGLFLLGALCLSDAGVAQSPVDRNTQWGEWVQQEPRSTVTRVQASLEAGNPIHLGAFLTLFEHYRLLWAEGKTDAEFLISLASVDKKLAETLLLFARQPPDAQLSRRAFTYYIVHSTRRLGTLPAPGVALLAEWYAQDLGVTLEPALMPSTRESRLHALKDTGILVNRLRYARDDVVPTTAFARQATTTYSRANAMWFAELSILTYFEPTMRRDQLGRWGFLPSEYQGVSDEPSDTHFFLTGTEEWLVLTFRGTLSLGNVATDLNILKSKEDHTEGSVHAGFKNALDAVWATRVLPLVRDRLRGRKLYVSGHSMGGALAQLAAYRLKHSGIDVAGVYTYGAPYIGDEDYVRDYDRILAARTHNHINHNDVVPYSPPWWLGYTLAAKDTGWRFVGTGHDLGPIDEQEARSKDPKPTGVQRTGGGLLTMDATVKQRLIERLTQADTAAQNAAEQRVGSPKEMEAVSYETTFASDRFNEHRSEEYLFKLGCALIEQHWKEQVRTARAR